MEHILKQIIDLARAGYWDAAIDLLEKFLEKLQEK